MVEVVPPVVEVVEVVEVDLEVDSPAVEVEVVDRVEVEVEGVDSDNMDSRCCYLHNKPQRLYHLSD